MGNSMTFKRLQKLETIAGTIAENKYDFSMPQK